MRAPELLKAWREQNELSQFAAAKLLDISQPTYSDYENRKKIPRTQKALSIAEKTGGAVPVSAWADETPESTSQTEGSGQAEPATDTTAA